MEALKFKTAFKYPFNRPMGLLNALWILLPIFGWFALGGYLIRIVREFLNGKFDQTPTFDFVPDMKLGFSLFVRYIPFILAYMVVAGLLQSLENGIIDLALFIVEVLALPIVGINFIKKGTVESSFEFKLVKVVIDNFQDYLIALGKTVVLGFIFAVMMIVLVGIPAGAFTQNMFLADFYRRKVKNSDNDDDVVIIPIDNEKVIG